MQFADSSTGFTFVKREVDMARTKFPASLWLLTNIGESLFDLSPEDLFTFELLAKNFYATNTQP